MRLPSYAIQAILILLYVVAVSTRLAGMGENTSPYYKGASAMNYRHAVAVADGTSLRAADRKANWPDGYTPASYRSAGAEILTGTALRAGRYFSDVDGRDFISRLLVLWFSLCVFTMYGLTRRLWDCQAAGLLAAAMVALFVPLIDATNGRQFAHAGVAIVFASIHALLVLRAHRSRSWPSAVLAAVIAFLIMAVWELGLYYVAAAVVGLTLVPSSTPAKRRLLIISHVAAAIAACVTLPYLRALHAAFTWPMAAMAGAVITSFTGSRTGGRVSRSAIIAASTVVLTLLMTPLRAGADTVPVLGYAWYRLRFLLDKPASAQLLPAEIRSMWSFDHAPPSRHALLSFFLPFAFFASALAMVVREGIRRHRRVLPVVLAIALLGTLAYAIDRSALVPAAMAIIPAIALSARGLSAAAKTRGPLVVLGAYLVVAQLAFPLGAANPTFQIAKGAGFALQDPNRFLWVSMENTDRQLVSFIASRTSVADAVLGSPDITALLLTFTGRTSLTLSGAVTTSHAERNAELMRALYEDEVSLYDTCRQLKISYVLYSIDFLLDTRRYSPAYLAGVPDVARDSMVFRMHFAPEGLRHFTLVYENPHYRLFKVTAAPETVFLTDHPPVYQLDAFDRVGGDAEAFRKRVIKLILTYRDANVDRAAGNFDAALKKLTWCLREAPGFTLARIGVGTTLTRAGRLEEARDVLLSVIGYAPDNTTALYHTAYTLAALGETDRASDYLQVFFTTAGDPDLIEKARLLKTFIDQGLPITPRSILE